MILSRTLCESDYKELEEEGKVITDVHDAIDMWYAFQHKHRLWEYSLAVKALWTVFGKDSHGLFVSDHGCGAGYLGPMMRWLGHNVWLYECWAMGGQNEQQQFMMEQMRRVSDKRPDAGVTYEMRNRPLCEMVEADRGVDAAFCISTLEHIGEYQKAFWDLLSTVKPGGLVFLTTDFAEDEADHYQYAMLRAGKMFNKDTYHELLDIAQQEGFRLVGDAADWSFTEENRIVLDYSFASMALRRDE